MKGRIVTVSGPAGVGKGTLVEIAMKKDPDLFLSVSCTTREIRVGETAGVTYHYISEEEFTRMVEADEFFEWANVHGHRYGTPCPPVYKAAEEGRNAILEIDIQGSAQVAAKKPDTVRIFILPPDWPTLRQRIIDRGRDTMEDVEKRLRNAVGEIKASLDCDYIITNFDKFEAAENLLHVIYGDERAQEFAIENQRDAILKLLRDCGAE